MRSLSATSMLLESRFWMSSSKIWGSMTTPLPRMHLIPVSWTRPSGISQSYFPSGRIPDKKIARQLQQGGLTWFWAFTAIESATKIVVRRQYMQQLLFAFLAPLKALNDAELRLQARLTAKSSVEHRVSESPHILILYLFVWQINLKANRHSMGFWGFGVLGFWG